MASFNIQLHHLRFTAAHGLYEEEALVQNEFEVNLSLTVKAPKEKVKSIEETINYAEAYQLIKDLFQKPERLLETLTMTIAEEIKLRFPEVKKLTIQIIKLHPPITGFTGSVSVTYNRKFKP